jgi:hypothetical protein
VVFIRKHGDGRSRASIVSNCFLAITEGSSTSGHQCLLPIPVTVFFVEKV